jgi:hypothetical protein
VRTSAQAIVGEVFNMPQAAQRARYNLSQHKLSQQKNGWAHSPKVLIQGASEQEIAALLALNFGATGLQPRKSRRN